MRVIREEHAKAMIPKPTVTCFHIIQSHLVVSATIAASAKQCIHPKAISLFGIFLCRIQDRQLVRRECDIIADGFHLLLQIGETLFIVLSIALEEGGVINFGVLLYQLIVLPKYPVLGKVILPITEEILDFLGN